MLQTRIATRTLRKTINSSNASSLSRSSYASASLSGRPRFLLSSLAVRAHRPACTTFRLQSRGYAQGPTGGGGFPGFSMKPQHQKGEALKEYVCLSKSQVLA